MDAGQVEDAQVLARPVLVSFLGWLVSLVLLWRSRIWTMRDKGIGTLLALGFGALGLIALLSPVLWLGSLLSMVQRRYPCRRTAGPSPAPLATAHRRLSTLGPKLLPVVASPWPAPRTATLT